MKERGAIALDGDPHGGQLHVAIDTAAAHYYMTVPLSDVEEQT